MMFRDRHHAGQVLAALLRRHSSRGDAVVLALPFGGVAVGSEVAHALHLPLDVLVARSLPVPGHPDLAMGAIAPGHVRVVDSDVVERFGIDADAMAGAEASALADLQRYEHAYHHGVPALPLSGKVVLLVDDGFASGPMLLAAIRALHQHQPARIVLALPVDRPEIRRQVADDVDEIVCARRPAMFGGAASWYADVGRTTEREVLDLLCLAREEMRPSWEAAQPDRS